MLRVFIFLLFLIPSCTNTYTGSIRGCPKILFVAEAKTIVSMGPDSYPENTLFKATFTDFQGTCKYEHPGLLQVDLDLILSIEKGTAFLVSQEAVYSYFVAIIAPDDQIVSHRNFETSLTFPPEALRSDVEEKLVHLISIDPKIDGRAYNILIGFKLTPEQLLWNQQQIRKD